MISKSQIRARSHVVSRSILHYLIVKIINEQNRFLTHSMPQYDWHVGYCAFAITLTLTHRVNRLLKRTHVTMLLESENKKLPANLCPLRQHYHCFRTRSQLTTTTSVSFCHQVRILPLVTMPSVICCRQEWLQYPFLTTKI